VFGVWFDLDRHLTFAYTNIPEPPRSVNFAAAERDAPDRWAAADPDERCGIAFTLARTEQLTAWHRDDVRDLLGEPSSRGDGLELWYTVGVVETFADVDALSLHVLVDQDDRVTGGFIR
jgi:hypothetical protein